jgi:ribosomal protein L25 (general stress protein Ctc)
MPKKIATAATGGILSSPGKQNEIPAVSVAQKKKERLYAFRPFPTKRFSQNDAKTHAFVLYRCSFCIDLWLRQ